jgi:flavin reductase (DIM6/NTAB) family NADH-FMN oxidoreductase RutF
MDPAIKKKVLRKFSYGLYLVTTGGAEDRGAFTANWLVQSSFEPPMLMIAVEQDAHSLDVLRRSGVFAVHPYEAGQRELAGHFGRNTAKVGDKLAGYTTRAGTTGAPLLEDTIGAVECRVVGEVPSGDHVVFVGEVVDAHLFHEDGEPLTMAMAGFRYSG